MQPEQTSIPRQQIKRKGRRGLRPVQRHFGPGQRLGQGAMGLHRQRHPIRQDALGRMGGAIGQIGLGLARQPHRRQRRQRQRRQSDRHLLPEGRHRGGAGARNLGRVQREQRFAHGALGRGHTGQRRGQGQRLGRRGAGQRVGQARRLHRKALLAGQPRQAQRALPAGHGHFLGGCGKDLTRHAAACHHLGPTHHDMPRAIPDLGGGQRVPIGAMVQRADQTLQRRRALREIEPPCRRGPICPEMQAAGREILRLPRGGAAFQRGQQIGEAVQRGFKAARVQRQRRITGQNGKAALQQNVAFIHAGGDQMPGDAMLHLAFQQRPDRGIQPGMARQGAIVKIDTAPRGPRQRRRRNQ